MTGCELSVLAAELARTTDPADAERLKERIIEGFYDEEDPA